MDNDDTSSVKSFSSVGYFVEVNSQTSLPGYADWASVGDFKNIL